MINASKAEPRFDLDLRYGQEAEERIRQFLGWVVADNGRVEVKRKRYLDLRFYVETHCDKGRKGIYQPSGISVTTSLIWVFVLGDTGIHVAIPTDVLREVLDDASSEDRREDDGDCPTRGKLVNFSVLLYRLQQRSQKGAGISFPGPAPVVVPIQVEPFVPLTHEDIPW